MLQEIISGIPLGIFLSFMVGPVFFVLLETSAIKGFRAALIFDLGVVLADIVYILIAYFSSYRLIQSIKNDPSIFLFGGILMLTYGIISYIKINRLSKSKAIDDDENIKKIDEEIIKKNYLGLFTKGLFLNFINVGVLLFWFLVVITVGPKFELDNSSMIVFFASVILTYLVIDIGKIILAKQLKHKMTPKTIIKMKKIISMVLIFFGVVLMIQGWFPTNTNIPTEILEKIE
jgi:threonine/homoserine/homoserine lactone efflux protein